MRSRLPPLFSLQVFEAAARHGKFSVAAAELNITQGAVSRQIKQLEAWTTQLLFERNGPRVDLTREGRALLNRLSAPLGALRTAVYGEPGAMRQALHVTTLASVARAILLPALPDFLATHPDIDLTIHTDYAISSLAPDLAAVSIRFAMPPPRELHAEELFGDRLLVVAAPPIAERLGADADRWQAQSLLRHTSDDWLQWLQTIDGAVALRPAGVEFNDAGVLLDAAEAGAGIALARFSVAYARLKSGRLTQVAPQIVTPARQHYLVCRRECADLPAVKSLRSWLQEQAAIWRERLALLDRSISSA
jgi:LysR family transcriptional regulator, glycine cleavage system transcriptional activator